MGHLARRIQMKFDLTWINHCSVCITFVQLFYNRRLERKRPCVSSERAVWSIMLDEKCLNLRARRAVVHHRSLEIDPIASISILVSGWTHELIIFHACREHEKLQMFCKENHQVLVFSPYEDCKKRLCSVCTRLLAKQRWLKTLNVRNRPILIDYVYFQSISNAGHVFVFSI